jgi:hypothetical protein
MIVFFKGAASGESLIKIIGGKIAQADEPCSKPGELRIALSMPQTRAWRTRSLGAPKFTLAAGLLRLPILSARPASVARDLPTETESRPPLVEKFRQHGKFFAQMWYIGSIRPL